MALVTRAGLVLGVFALICLPGIARARSQGVRFSRTPAVVEPKNSQTMALLEGHMNTNSIPTGTPRLAIVDGSALSAEADRSHAYIDVGKSGTGQISVYVVRNGDSLPALAKMFEVSVNTIKWANDLKGSTVSEGQELVILPISGIKHIAKKGDTLESIAKMYKADVGDILAFNDVTIDTKLGAGDIIIVPDGELGSIAVAPKPSTGSKSKLGSSPFKRTGDTTPFEPLLVNVRAYPSYPGYYARPIAGGLKTQDLHGYNGVDLAAPSGTPIYAAAEGTVIISKNGGYNGGYGTYVVISHPNGSQTLYAHMSRDMVNVGQHVSQGVQIGAIGSSGWSTGAHLHFEIRGAKNPF